MKRIVATIVLFVNLLSGVAFAWDSHPEALAGGDPQVAQVLAADRVDAHVDHCDHCCHGAAHLVGLICELEGLHLAAPGHLAPAPADSLSSLYVVPLLRPPIV